MFKTHLALLLLGLSVGLVGVQPASAGSKFKLPYCATPEIKNTPLTRDQKRQLKKQLAATKGEGFRLYNASDTRLYVAVNGATYQLSPRQERYITGKGRRVTIDHPRSFGDLGDRGGSFRVYTGTEMELVHVLYRDNNRVKSCFTIRAV